MVDDEVGFVVVHVREEGGEVEAAEVEEKAGKGEVMGLLEEVQGCEEREVGACGLGVARLVRVKVMLGCGVILRRR